MSVERSYSSWHPALRPNSMADLAETMAKTPASPIVMANASLRDDSHTQDTEFTFNHVWHPAFRPNSMAELAVRMAKPPASPAIFANASAHDDSHTLEDGFAFHHVWHPAFMPSSAAHSLSKDARGSTNDISLSIRPTSASHTNHRDLQTDSKVDIDQRNILEHPSTPKSPENEVNPDLEILRGALTTALASPGGVEMDENPVHSGQIADEERNSELVEAGEQAKSEFPSEGPTDTYRQIKSSSAAAFVPVDFDSEEEDDVDPEWNFKGAESNPFQAMAKTKRTNSFPAIPPVHLPNKISSDQILTRSQAGEIMHQIEQPSHSLFSDDDREENFLDDRTMGKSPVEEDLFGYQRGLGEDNSNPESYDRRAWNDELDKSYGGDAPQDLDFEARFEEGLPLIADMEPAEPAVAAPSQVSNPTSQLFSDDEYDEGDSFFAGVGDSSTAEPPATFNLGRRSTLQVLESIHFQPHENMYPASPEFPDLSTLQISADSALLKTAPADERLLPDDDVISIAKAREPSEDDLAARWKAALDGEEFLDDDDFLADDPASAEKAVADPSAFFGSDDEGFLEDDEEEFNLAGGTAMSEQEATSSKPFASNEEMAVSDKDTKTSGQRNRQNSLGRYMPPGVTQTVAQPPSNPYSPTSLLLTDLSSPASQNSNRPYDLSRVGQAVLPPSTSNIAPQQTRPEAAKAQSFADKAKGGYASPYDLPMEVIKPRKRHSSQQTSHGFNASTPVGEPPPRSSSMSSQGQSISHTPSSSISTPKTGQSTPSIRQTSQASQSVAHPPQTLKSKASFFEDLPIANKVKPGGRHSSKPGSPAIGLPSPSHVYSPPSQAAEFPEATQPSVPRSRDLNHGLIAPPPTNPYAPLTNGQSIIAPPTSRYSPAPSQVHAQIAPPPAPQGRYAAVPTLQRQPSSSVVGGLPKSQTPPFSHQPRTSSPLAHFERSHDRNSYGPQSSTVSAGADRRGSSTHEHAARAPNLPPTKETDEQIDEQRYNVRHGNLYSTQEQAKYVRQQVNRGTQPPKVSNIAQSRRVASSYVSDFQPQPGLQDSAIIPPRRSQTQSPGSAVKGPRMEMIGEPYQRPISVHGPTSPSRPYEPYSAEAPRTRTRGFSQGLNYIAPTDGREHDPLQRWRGSPVFAWGVGGTVITSFPKEVPRYGVGQALPMIQSSPGEIKVRNIKDLYPLEERLSSFPGPLKGKSKKKETIAWLSTGIEILEAQNMYLRSTHLLSHEDKRKEERVLLWKLLRVMIEHDGLLEGNPSVNASVRAVLSPGIELESSNATPQYATGADLTGIYRARGAAVPADPVDPAAVDILRRHLLRGDREKAVWEAVDKRLWAHALLISNTLSKELYKQVAQEFVLKEVKPIGENTESLAALYEIFAGNFEESIDELVPPSARAGFQMVTTSSATGNSKNAIDGLDRWRETLGLVLSNRSSDDNQAINALGKLLSGYGRAEAAHICFLFARTYSVFGGIDDPMSNIVLLGSDHHRQPYEFDRELEPILLSEVYEYGFSLSSTSNIPISSAHLAVYKLQHATILAEFGQREKALQYCEAIAASITSQTRRSPYHHPSLVAALEDLSKRLKQSPKDESSSWISKPSIDKVSGSVWAKFNKFVAGEDNDAGSTTSGDPAPEIGPFARIAGGTPTISRSPSNLDMYGSHGAPAVNGVTSIPSGQRATSRYAPGGSYTPPVPYEIQASSYGSQRSFTQPAAVENSVRQEKDYTFRAGPLSQPPTPSAIHHSNYIPQGHEGFSASSQNSYGQAQQSSGETNIPPNASEPPISTIYDYYRPSGNSESPQGYFPAHSSYEPHASENYILPQGTGPEPLARDRYQPPGSSGYEVRAANSYIPPINGFGSPVSGSYEPPTNNGYEARVSSGYEPPSSGGYEPNISRGYAPPASSAYEPPTNSVYEAPTSSGYEPPTSSGYEPPASSDYESPINRSYETAANNTYESPESAGYEPPTSSGYEPPTSSGYEPPSDTTYDLDPQTGFEAQPSTGYEPPAYEPTSMFDEPDSPVDTRPKKKSIMDDEDEDGPREQKAVKTKAEKDREADEAFRKAAEADAKKDIPQSPKKGWGLGGWFGGKKDGAIDTPAPNKPIKAKLGEASSFYYDPDQKRWVNKKGSKDDPSVTRSETPPPPRSLPRAASGPPSTSAPSARNTPPPRTASATSMKGFDGPVGFSTSVPPPMSRTASNGSASGGPPTAPPSRPATSMSNASSIDDLLGLPGARKAGAKKPKRGRGYIDVMGDKGAA